MSKVLEKLNLFSVRAFNSSESIAVVGNGGISDEDNEHINNAGCVVRFNNYATRKDLSYTKDRFRCDLLVSTFDLHSNHSDPKAVLIAIPYPFKAKDIDRKIDKWYPKAAPYMVNPYMSIRMCQELGLDSLGYQHPLPSVGTTLLWNLKFLLDRFLNFNPNVYVCGFNWYSDKEKKTIQGRRVILPKASHFNHHYREEMKWVIDNIYQKKHFTFSKECSSILEVFSEEFKSMEK